MQILLMYWIVLIQFYLFNYMFLSSKLMIFLCLYCIVHLLLWQLMEKGKKNKKGKKKETPE